MDPIQFKKKELQSKMYLTQTHWTHKIGNLSCNKLQKKIIFIQN